MASGTGSRGRSTPANLSGSAAANLPDTIDSVVSAMCPAGADRKHFGDMVHGAVLATSRIPGSGALLDGEGVLGMTLRSIRFMVRTPLGSPDVAGAVESACGHEGHDQHSCVLEHCCAEGVLARGAALRLGRFGTAFSDDLRGVVDDITRASRGIRKRRTAHVRRRMNRSGR